MDDGMFTAGVRPGGLTQEYEVKVLICYILDNLQKTMTFDELNEVLQSEGVVNYFEFAGAISDLLTSGHILALKRQEGEQVYRLTDIGQKTAQTFSKNLPLSVREGTTRRAQEYLLQKRLEKENQVQLQKVEDGYTLGLRITDIGSDLLNISLFVPSEAAGKAIGERFLKDPALVYRGVIALLTGDETALGMILERPENERE